MTPLFTLLLIVSLAAGLSLGLAAGALGADRRLNLLDPPLLGLLAWNLVVYAALVWRALQPAPHGAQPLRDAVASLARRVGGRRGLDAAQAATALHAGAAAFALGALASMYLRGMAFEYRAGWESTFLSVQTVHAVLSWLLAPASFITGIALPASDELAHLSFTVGGGENAARWIHLYAVTVALFVLVPRGVLALLAGRRAAARPARAIAHRGVRVLPYSCRVLPESRERLSQALSAQLGAAVHLELAPSVPLGGEDDIENLLPAHERDTVAVVFALTATPEEENHGAFVDAVHARVRQVIVVVDETAFVQRFTGAEAVTRRTQRRAAWQRVLERRGLTPAFVELGAAP